MRIIALSAKAGCGKTTTANMLLDLLPGAVRMSFGDPVKQEAAATYGFPLELCYSEAGKQSVVFIGEEGLKNLGAHTLQVRQILQRHGTDFRRAQDPAYWDNKMREALAAADASGCSAVVVDDARFPSELELLRAAGGELYRIEPFPGWTPGAHALHESETALDGYASWDACFYPEKGMEQLQAVAKCIFNKS